MDRHIIAGLVTVTALFVMPITNAKADDASHWNATLSAASQYISKGAGKSDGAPHLSLAIERTLGRNYLGAWTGNVKTSQGADSEVHLWAGAKPRIGPVQLDLRAIYKTAPGTRAGVQKDLLELRADASRSFGAWKWRQRIEYSPNSYAATQEAWWFETQVSHALPGDITGSAAIARRQQNLGLDYAAWNIGINRTLSPKTALDLRWHDTDAHIRGAQYDGRLVISLNSKF